MDFETLCCPWGDNLKTCAITVCDLDGVVLYQNARSCEVNGDVRGRSMIPCHSARSREIINRLMTNGENNAYTIEKRGIRKLKCVYSLEEPLEPQVDEKSARETPEGRRALPGSVSFVPSVAGLIIAGEVIKDLIK